MLYNGVLSMEVPKRTDTCEGNVIRDVPDVYRLESGPFVSEQRSY